MESTITLNVSDYVSKDEMKEIVIEEMKARVRSLFNNEENTKRILSNLSYQIVFDEVDKIIPNSKELIVSKTEHIIKNLNDHHVFRDETGYSKASLATQYVLDAVRANKDLLNQKVKDTIENKDYSEEVWTKFEQLADTFMSNIYSIVELGRSKKS